MSSLHLLHHLRTCCQRPRPAKEHFNFRSLSVASVPASTRLALESSNVRLAEHFSSNTSHCSCNLEQPTFSSGFTSPYPLVCAFHCSAVSWIRAKLGKNTYSADRGEHPGHAAKEDEGSSELQPARRLTATTDSFDIARTRYGASTDPRWTQASSQRCLKHKHPERGNPRHNSFQAPQASEDASRTRP